MSIYLTLFHKVEMSKKNIIDSPLINNSLEKEKSSNMSGYDLNSSLSVITNNNHRVQFVRLNMKGNQQIFFSKMQRAKPYRDFSLKSLPLVVFSILRD